MWNLMREGGLPWPMGQMFAHVAIVFIISIFRLNNLISGEDIKLCLEGKTLVYIQGWGGSTDVIKLDYLLI